MDAIEKAQKAADDAAKALADIREAEAQKAAQAEAQREADQREKDVAFLAAWESMDEDLSAGASISATQAVYNGQDPVSAIAAFWVARTKRNVIRDYARAAYQRVHGQPADAAFALELSYREMRITERLEEAISGAARLHAADLTDALDRDWVAS